MSKRPWMPFYVADYIRDTRHLSPAQHGSYFLLILEYWQRGGLPQDEGQLARLAGMTSEEWMVERNTIAKFFEPGWKHPRIDKEIERIEDISKKRALAASSNRKSNIIPFKDN